MTRHEYFEYLSVAFKEDPAFTSLQSRAPPPARSGYGKIDFLSIEKAAHGDTFHRHENGRNLDYTITDD